MTEPETILCVEDDLDSSDLLQFILENEGFQVVSCPTSEEALQFAGERKFSAIVLDHCLANISGLEICRRIRTYDKIIPIIFFSGSAYPRDRKAGLDAGANVYLVKPLDLELVPETIKSLIDKEYADPFVIS